MNSLPSDEAGAMGTVDGRAVHRFHMILSPNNPLQREAWEWINALPPAERTNAVCYAICRTYSEQDLLEKVRRAVREIIREELDEATISARIRQTGQENVVESIEPVDYMTDEVNSFLDSLDCDG